MEGDEDEFNLSILSFTLTAFESMSLIYLINTSSGRYHVVYSNNVIKEGLKFVRLCTHERLDGIMQRKNEFNR